MRRVLITMLMIITFTSPIVSASAEIIMTPMVATRQVIPLSDVENKHKLENQLTDAQRVVIDAMYFKIICQQKYFDIFTDVDSKFKLIEDLNLWAGTNIPGDLNAESIEVSTNVNRIISKGLREKYEYIDEQGYLNEVYIVPLSEAVSILEGEDRQIVIKIKHTDKVLE